MPRGEYVDIVGRGGGGGHGGGGHGGRGGGHGGRGGGGHGGHHHGGHGGWGGWGGWGWPYYGGGWGGWGGWSWPYYDYASYYSYPAAYYALPYQAVSFGVPFRGRGHFGFHHGHRRRGHVLLGADF